MWQLWSEERRRGGRQYGADVFKLLLDFLPVPALQVNALSSQTLEGEVLSRRMVAELLDFGVSLTPCGNLKPGPHTKYQVGNF